MGRARERVRHHVIAPLREFLATEAAGGVVLLIGAAIALTWANGPLRDSYSRLWEWEFGPGAFHLSLREWIDDGLMTVFFFVVGLEIKRELVTGELREPRKAALPVMAAVGGMAGPAAVYLALNSGTPYARGWGIPVATDIAFSVGLLAVLGRRIPAGLKIFLLTLAIADDIGGIVVIAVFYAQDLSVAWLAVAASSIAVVALLKRVGADSTWWYIAVGVGLWIAMFRSGVHPTIAGVVLGLLTPAHPVDDQPVLEELEHRLHPLSSFVIVPLFAIANAGVALDAQAVREAASSKVFWGVAAGLLIGKPIGVCVATAVSVKARIGRLPDGVRAAHIIGMSFVAGIGFTVALFVTGIALPSGPATDAAKAGVLIGSLLSAILGLAVLSRLRSYEGSKSTSD